MPIEPMPDSEVSPSYSLTAYHQVGEDYPAFVNLTMTVENFDAVPIAKADELFQELVDLLGQSVHFTGANGQVLRGSKSWATAHGEQITQTVPQEPEAPEEPDTSL